MPIIAAHGSLHLVRNRLLHLAPLAAAGLTFVFGLLLLQSERNQIGSTAQAHRHNRGIAALNSVHLHLKDAETNQRGYLLTANESFLAQYEVAWEQAEAALEEMQAAALSDVERQTAESLATLARRRLTAGAAVLALMQERGSQAAARQIADGDGRRAMAEFEATVGMVRNRVSEMQQAQEAEQQRRYRTLLWLIGLGTVGVSFAGAASGSALSRHARERDEAALSLTAANTELLEQSALLLENNEELAAQAAELEDQSLQLELQTQELEEAARRLAERDARFRALVGHAADMIFVLDRNGRISYASPPVAAVLERQPESLYGEALVDLIHTEDRPTIETVLDEAIASGSEAVYEARHAHADGSWRILSCNVRNLLDDATVGGIVVNCRDVSRQRSVEVQLRQSQKMEAIGRLAGGVAHDFNNLLTSIKGYSQFAIESLDGSHDAHADLQEVLKAADLASSLTRQLLTFSRQQVTKPEVLVLNEVLDDSAGLLRRLLGSSVELVTRLDPSLRPVFVDAGQIRQVIMNLAVNANDAMPEGGRLVIETSNVGIDSEHAERRGVAPGRYVLISVTDTGEGIPADVQERIFDPFFTTKAPGQGTGLGLSTAYGIVQQAGGYMWVYSELDNGTTFKIYLPAAAPDPGSEPEAAQDAPPCHTVRGAAVLVVEDDDAVRRFAERALQRAGFDVLGARSGEEALTILGREPAVRVVVTDIIMPGMSGAALGRHVDELYPDLQVLYTSGYPREEMSWRGSVPPNVAFISKPYSSTELAQQVAELLHSEPRGNGDRAQ